MTVSKDDLEIGEWFEGVLLELFVPQKGSTRPRVRPVSDLPEGLRVEFPRDLRTATVIGTRFRADVKVCQKHNQADLISMRSTEIADTVSQKYTTAVQLVTRQLVSVTQTHPQT